MQKTVYALVSGIVQGVFYRAFIRSAAQGLKLAGWVRNREDGQVEFMAQGDEEALMMLIARAKQGPSGARVDEIRLEWQQVPIDNQAFSIIYS